MGGLEDVNELSDDDQWAATAVQPTAMKPKAKKAPKQPKAQGDVPSERPEGEPQVTAKAKAKAKGQPKAKGAMKRPAASGTSAPPEKKPATSAVDKAYKCFYSRDGVHGIKFRSHEIIRARASVSQWQLFNARVRLLRLTLLSVKFDARLRLRRGFLQSRWWR